MTRRIGRHHCHFCGKSLVDNACLHCRIEDHAALVRKYDSDMIARQIDDTKPLEQRNVRMQRILPPRVRY